MSEVKQKLIDELEKIGKVNFVKKIEDPKDAFSHYFSNLDINGIDRILSNQNYYDGITKLEYLNLIKEHFKSLNKNNIHMNWETKQRTAWFTGSIRATHMGNVIRQNV